MRKWTFLLSFGFLLFQSEVYGLGVAGGIDNGTEPYAVLVSESGEATEVSGPGVPVGNGAIVNVAINGSGNGILVGQDMNSTQAYLSIFNSSGITTRITGDLPIDPSSILAAAINESGVGIIGGADNVIVDGYAVIVSPTGVASNITGQTPMGAAAIFSADINDSGNGIISGFHMANVGYVATVSPAGVATQISGAIPGGAANVLQVAINNSGNAVAAGIENTNEPYLVTISPSGVAAAVTGDAPTVTGQINSVDINNSGTAIAGGADNGTDPYAVLISSGGAASAITGPFPATGSVDQVAINDSGNGILGGTDTALSNTFYFLVSPSGAATSISGELPVQPGVMGDVAINNLGVALISGRENGTDGYLALVSPSGVATKVTGDVPMLTANVRAVALGDFMDAVIPESVGGGNTFALGPLALSSQILPNHLLLHHLTIQKSFREEDLKDEEEDLKEDVALLASASEVVQKKSMKLPFRKNPEKRVQPGCPMTKYAVWATPFGDFAHTKSGGGFPTTDNWLAGIMAGFDYNGIRNTTIGFGAAYVFNHADFDNNLGHANTHQEFLTLYGTWERRYFYIQLALWGGLYQTKNTRNSLLGITSKADINGWLFYPHLEISTPIYRKKGSAFLTFDPFFMFDWVNNWQGRIHESGASGFNLRIGSQYTSLLRTEAGFRIFEAWDFSWGTFTFMQKASWVNKKPFNTSQANAVFVGSTTSFGVEIFSGRTQNLGVGQLTMWFVPCNPKYPYGMINYQGEFGGSFRNHLVSVEIGGHF